MVYTANREIDFSVYQITPTEVARNSGALPPVEGSQNVARLSVARHAARIEGLRRRARIIASKRNAGDFDTACLIAAAHETGVLREVDSRFATIHDAEVADVTGISLTPIGKCVKRVTEDPLVAQIFQHAQLRALERQQSIVRPEDVLTVLAATPSIGSVALARLRSIAEERTTPLKISDELLDVLLRSRQPVMCSILDRT